MRPALEVADIFRRHGDAFRTAQGRRLSPDQRRVMAAIEACRTATLGGHVADSDDRGQLFRLMADSILIDRGQRSGDHGQMLSVDIVIGS